MHAIDAKKAVILPLLDALRNVNPEIGSYDKSILNDQLQFAIKLSNGRLLIPQEIVLDFEQSPAFLTDKQLRQAVSTFIPSQEAGLESPTSLHPPINSDSPHSYYSAQQKQGSSTLKKILLLIAIIILGLVGYFIYEQIDKEQQATQIEDTKSKVRNNILDYVTVWYDDYQYRKIGGISNLVVHLRNTSDYMMENVKITITYIKIDGGVWRNQDYDFKMLSPNSEGTIKVPDTNRGVNVKVRIIEIKSTTLGL